MQSSLGYFLVGLPFVLLFLFLCRVIGTLETLTALGLTALAFLCIFGGLTLLNP